MAAGLGQVRGEEGWEGLGWNPVCPLIPHTSLWTHELAVRKHSKKVPEVTACHWCVLRVMEPKPRLAVLCLPPTPPHSPHAAGTPLQDGVRTGHP